MNTSKTKVITAQSLLYFTVAICFLAQSDGFRWNHLPPAHRLVQLGQNLTLRWNYSFDSGEDFLGSRLYFGSHEIASRNAISERYLLYSAQKIPLEIYGKENVTLIAFSVKRIVDGKWCLSVTYGKGDPGELEKKRNCSVIETFDYPEIISHSSRNVTANVSDNVTFSCNASGKPTPVIRWTKSSNTSHVLSTSTTYQLQTISSENDGHYICIAINDFGMDNVSFYLRVQFPPVIMEDKIKINATEGENITLICKANGYPAPVVIWIDSNNMTSPGPEKLLTEVKRTSSPYYRCIATNVVGKDEHKMYLHVFYKPEILYWKEEQRVNEGSNILLTCNSAGNQVPKTIWIKSDDILKELAQDLGNVTHNITKATKANAGEYLCNATNNVGSVSRKTKLIVQYKPEKTKLNSNGSKDIIIGENLILICTTDAVPPAQYYVFYRNDDIIANLSKGIFSKERVNSYDGGPYKCIPFNYLGEGEVSNILIIKILEYPEFIAKLQNLTTINENETITLYCNTSGNPHPNVTWTKDNSSVVWRGEVYTKENFKRSDAGVYTCTASNGVGKSISAQTKIAFNYKPVQTTLTSNTQQNAIVINETLALYCRTQALPPASRYIYYKDDSIKENSTKETYTVKAVSLSDNGIYKCVPQNLLGKGKPSNNLTITILVPPDISVDSPKYVVNESQSVILRCISSGNPAPNITWTKDGYSDVVYRGPEYTLFNTTRNDSGLYRCTANNGVRKPAWHQTVVVINYKPIQTTLTTNTGSSKVIIKDTLRLICTTQAVPFPKMFRFFRNGMSIKNSTNGTFTIDRVSIEDEGTYSCTPENTLGKGDSSRLNIVILEPPFLYNSQPSITVKLTDTILLQCNATGKPTPNITWTKEGSSHVIYEGKLYNKRNAEKCDAGIYICTANNGVRRPVHAESAVTIISLPEIPEIQNIVITKHNAKIHWKQPKTNCSLDITGYVAHIRKKEIEDEWMECPAKPSDSNLWFCSLGDLDSGTLYNVKIIAENRFGQGKPAEREFRTKEGGDLSESGNKSKGLLSKQNYIILAACVGGLVLIIMTLVLYKKLKKKQGVTLETPIELNFPADDQAEAKSHETQNVHNGPMTARHETLEVNEVEGNRSDKEKGGSDESPNEETNTEEKIN